MRAHGSRKAWSRQDRDAFAVKREDDIEKMKETVKGQIEEFSILAQREAGSELMAKWLKAMGAFHQYSFRNQILIVCQRPDATRVAGFQAWKKLGRFVKKGEKGIAILRPQLNRKQATMADVAKGKAEVDKDGNPIFSWLSFKVAFVFALEQTEGAPLPSLRCTDDGDSDAGMVELAEAAKRMGITLKFVESELPTGINGQSHGGLVLVRESLSPAAKVATLAHELAHEVLHKNRGDGPTTVEEQALAKSIREAEAEAAAYCIAQHFGHDHPGAARYVAAFMGAQPKAIQLVLGRSMDRIRDAVTQILGGRDADDD